MPTRTNPFLRTPRAVVRPRPGAPWKNVAACPDGATSPFGVSLTIVVPVPWALALLLKFETRTSPGAIVPPEGNLRGTIATPYGLRSPFGGTVDDMMISGKNGSGSPPLAENAGNAAAAVAISAAASIAAGDGKPPICFIGLSSLTGHLRGRRTSVLGTTRREDLDR